MTNARLIESEHYFVYSTSEPISAAMLAESLIGLDGVINHSTRVLASIFQTRIKSGGVLIKKIEFGSYKDDFIVRMFLGKGRTLEKNIESLRKKFGLQTMDTKTVIKWAIIIVIGFGIYKYAIESKDQRATISITNSFNNWGKDVGLSGDELIAKLDAIVTNKDDLKKQVVRLTRPKGSTDNGQIVLDNDSNFSIAAEAVAVVPSNYQEAEPEEPIKDFDKESIVIRAADLDRQTGWYGIAPGISDKRVHVQLEQSVDRSKIVLGKYNEADITVIYELDKAGDKHPKKYIIRKIHTLEALQTSSPATPN